MFLLLLSLLAGGLPFKIDKAFTPQDPFPSRARETPTIAVGEEEGKSYLYFVTSVDEGPDRIKEWSRILPVSRNTSPLLTSTVGINRYNRVLAWQERNGLKLLRLSGMMPRGPVEPVSLPWPGASIIPPPLLDASGVLYLFLAQKRNEREEVLLCSLTYGSHTPPSFEKVWISKDPIRQAYPFILENGTIHLALLHAQGKRLSLFARKTKKRGTPFQRMEVWNQENEKAIFTLSLLGAKETFGFLSGVVLFSHKGKPFLSILPLSSGNPRTIELPQFRMDGSTPIQLEITGERKGFLLLSDKKGNIMVRELFAGATRQIREVNERMGPVILSSKDGVFLRYAGQKGFEFVRL